MRLKSHFGKKNLRSQLPFRFILEARHSWATLHLLFVDFFLTYCGKGIFVLIFWQRKGGQQNHSVLLASSSSTSTGAGVPSPDSSKHGWGSLCSRLVSFNGTWAFGSVLNYDFCFSSLVICVFFSCREKERLLYWIMPLQGYIHVMWQS